MNAETARWIAETSDPSWLPYLRASMQERQVSAAELARRAGKSSSWGALVVRGDYPYRGAGAIPKGFWQAAQSLMQDWRGEEGNVSRETSKEEE